MDDGATDLLQQLLHGAEDDWLASRERRDRLVAELKEAEAGLEAAGLYLGALERAKATRPSRAQTANAVIAAALAA